MCQSRPNRHGGTRRTAVLVVVPLLVGGLGLGLGACSAARPTSTATSVTSVASETSSPTGTTSPSPSPVPATPPGAPLASPPTVAPGGNASALGDLAAFVGAARELDGRLHTAASLVDGTVRADVVVVDQRTAAAVQGLTLSALTSAVPPGLPPALMRRVLTTFSDLASRVASMSRFRYADRTYSRNTAGDPTAPNDGAEMVACLANGSEAAHRFDGDLAAVVALAASTPPLPSVGPSSLARAELQVRLAEIVLRNFGCDTCGGYVANNLSVVVWDGTDPSATTRTGRILDAAHTGSAAGDDGGVRFTATYTRSHGWTVQLNAC